MPCSAIPAGTPSLSLLCAVCAASVGTSGSWSCGSAMAPQAAQERSPTGDAAED
jgi:hypothetical protein